MIKRIPAVFALLLSPLALAACQPPPEPAPLAGAKIGGPFSLIDPAGKSVTWDSFSGNYRIVYFGYARCPDVCPTDMARLMQAFALFKAENPALAAQVRPIFITIDPRRDTPEKVGEFTRAFSDDLTGLTGTPEQVAVAAKAFGAYYDLGEVEPDGEYWPNHSRAAYLMGKQGEPIALLSVDEGTGEEAVKTVAAEMARWIR